MKIVSIFDPTAKDEQSRVRGIGRYFTTLKEMARNDPKLNHPEDSLSFQFTADLASVKKDHLFINPFFNPIQKPLKLFRISHKQIAVIHDLIPFKYPAHFPIGIKGTFFSWLNSFALKNYDLIITDSLVSKQDIMGYFKLSEKRVQVIYPTCSQIFLPHLDRSDESIEHHHPFHKNLEHSVAEFTQLHLSKITKNPALQNLKEYMVYVGDSTWNKNLPGLAYAVKMAQVPCVFVGKIFDEFPKRNNKRIHPWEKPLADFFKIVGNDPNFIFPGFISDIELLHLYKHAQLNILVSFDEGFGYSFIEAGCMSTPSILSDIPVFREIAKDSAEFVPPKDPKIIAQKISELFYDRVKREKMSIKAFERVQEFHPNIFKKSWMQTLARAS